MQEKIRIRTADPSPTIADRIAIISTANDILSSYCFHIPHCGRHVPLLRKNWSLQILCVELAGRTTLSKEILGPESDFANKQAVISLVQEDQYYLCNHWRWS